MDTDRLIVALDVSGVSRAADLVDRLGEDVTFYKIGYELALSGGLAFVKTLAQADKKVFLDLKLHDIGATVEKAVAAVAEMGATFLTVHGYPQTMRAAQRAARHTGLKILAVSVLTSYDDEDVAAAGYRLGAADLVALRARQAREIGLAGLILSPREVATIRDRVGADFLLVTPGVRPAESDSADQKRVATPAEAIAAGADHLVVGRPVTAAADPKAAAQKLQREIAAARGSNQG